MPTGKYIAVIGAGTAGSAAAIRLRQLGHRVLLIERSETSDLQIGESVPGAILRPLQTLGFRSLEDLLSPEEFRKCPAIASSWGDDEWYFKDSFRNPEGGGWQILRHRFDVKLRKRALEMGCEWLEGSFERLETGKNQPQLVIRKPGGSTETISVESIIDSSGRNSKLINQLNIKKNRSHEQAAVYTWLKIPGDALPVSKLKTEEKGWWYTSLLPDELRVVSFHCLPETAREYQRNPELFAATLNATGMLPQSVSAGQFVKPLQARDASTALASKICGANWVAVGDAALSFDPISAQGIFFALYSAIRGAEALVSENRAFPQAYEAQVRQIAHTNNSLRMQYYTSELRYLETPYWKQYFR
jgi:flavin-dependent dehydrogenase